MRLLTVQALRGLAANAVLLSHLAAFERAYAGPDSYVQFMRYGSAGVDMFFVISGFIMVATTIATTNPAGFLWNRATRIYPIYWVASLIYLAFALGWPTLLEMTPLSELDFWKSALLIPQAESPLVVVAWTLILELWFYIVFAGMLFLRIPIWAGAALWAALLVGIYASGFPIFASSISWQTLSPLALEFIFGMGVGLLWKAGFKLAALPSLVIGLVGLVTAVLWAAPYLEIQQSAHFQALRTALFGIPSVLIVYGCVSLERPGARVPKLLTRMGDWSYSTYLMHLLILALAGVVIRAIPVDGPFDNIILIVGGLVACNAVGWLMFSTVERPILKAIRSIQPFYGNAARKAL